MARKGENIYKRKDGRWEGRCRARGIAGRKPGYISVYGKSYREVKEKLFLKKEEQMSGKKGGGKLPAGMSVGKLLLCGWKKKRGDGKNLLMQPIVL